MENYVFLFLINLAEMAPNARNDSTVFRLYLDNTVKQVVLVLLTSLSFVCNPR